MTNALCRFWPGLPIVLLHEERSNGVVMEEQIALLVDVHIFAVAFIEYLSTNIPRSLEAIQN
jgi:hypothetical protein